MTMHLTTAPISAKARAFQSFPRSRTLQALLAILIFFNLTAFLPQQTSTSNFVHDAQPGTAKLASFPKASQEIGRVVIASLLKDNEEILKAGWSDAVVNLTRALGPENVWISIHESGSRDGTKNELQSLHLRLMELGAGHEINMADVGEDMHDMMPRGGPGWLNVKGERVMRRIPWLAELRNLNLEPLRELKTKKIVFDKMLFLNDIIFTSDDALELLHTRNGDYAAACGFDYSRPWPSVAFYDQFATRDFNGQELAALYHPYFAKGRSRDALQKGLPAPVKSCWSGIAAFDAAPFQDLRNPLRFRAVNDSLAEYYLEASECCLIHYDNPLSAFRGVWMNPKVRVGYDDMRYDAVHQPSGWPSMAATILGHLSDLLTWIVPLSRKRKVIDLRYEEWTQKSPLNTEAGADCLVHKLMIVSEKGKWSEVEET
jgi:Cryptococcal mannosyltransferase 1